MPRSFDIPVVTLNGPGPIIGQDYDKIVLGWTEGATRCRALEAAADEAALRGSLLSVVTVSSTAAYTRGSFFRARELEQALLDSIRRIESTHPGLPIDVIHRIGHVVAELEQSLDRAALLVLGSYQMPRGGRDVQRPGPCVCACSGRGGTNTMDRALRAHRIRRILPVVVGTCRGRLAQAGDHVRA